MHALARSAVVAFLILSIPPAAVLAQAPPSADQTIHALYCVPDPVVPGNLLTCTVEVRNDGLDPAENSAVDLSFPGMTWDSDFPVGDFTCLGSGSTARCTAASFAPGPTLNIPFLLRVPEALLALPDGTLSLVASISSPTPDPDAVNNAASITVAYDSPQIDLSVVIADVPDPVAHGGDVTYTVVLKNSGPDHAGDVTVTFANAGTLQFVSLTAPPTAVCATPAIGAAPSFACTLPGIAAGDLTVMHVVTRIDPDLPGSTDTTAQQQVTISASGNEVNPADNSAAAWTTFLRPRADLAVSASASPDPADRETEIVYIVNVTSFGADTAEDVTLTFADAGTLEFMTVIPQPGAICAPPALGATPAFNCVMPSLAQGASMTVIFVARPNIAVLGPADATLQMTFTAAHRWVDPDPSNDSVTVSTAFVVPKIDLAVTLADAPDPVPAGGDITYGGTIANFGPDPAEDVVVTFGGSADVRFVSFIEPAGALACVLPPVGAAPSFTCTVPHLAALATVPFQFVVNADYLTAGLSDTTIVQSVSISGWGSDANPVNDQWTESTVYEVRPGAAGIAASTLAGPVIGGSTLEYAVTPLSHGPADALGVTVVMPLHAALRFAGISSPGLPTPALPWNCVTPAVGFGGTVTCTAAKLAGGVPPPALHLVTTVDPAFGAGTDGSIDQSFTISAASPDPDLTDNTVTLHTAYVAHAELALSVADSPDPVASNNRITYTITLANNGPSPANNVALDVDALMPLYFISLATPPGFSCPTLEIGALPELRCTSPTMAAGTTATFTLVTGAYESRLGVLDMTIQQRFAASSSTTDPSPENNDLTVDTAYDAVAADIEVTAVDSPDPVLANSDLTFVVTVTNHGPDPATGVSFQVSPYVHDLWGTTLTFRSISEAAPGAGFVCAPPAVGTGYSFSCSGGSLAVGAATQFTVVMNTEKFWSDQTITTGFSAGTGDVPDPDWANNQAKVTTAFHYPRADLSVTGAMTPSTVKLDETLTWTVNVTNAGPDDAVEPVLTLTLYSRLWFQTLVAPPGFTCSTPAVGTSGVATCTAPFLANGATATFTLTATIDPDLDPDWAWVSARAEIDSATRDDDTMNDAHSVGASVDVPDALLSLAVTDTPDPVKPNGELTYSVGVANSGPDPASNVTLTIPLGPNLRFLSAAAPAGWNCATPPVDTAADFTCTTKTMLVGAAGHSEFVVVARADAADFGLVDQTIDRTFSVSTSTHQPFTDWNTRAVSTQYYVPKPDVTIHLSGGGTIYPDRPFLLFIEPRNLNVDAAEELVVTLPIPAPLRFLALDGASPGWTCVVPAAETSGEVVCSAPLLRNWEWPAIGISLVAREADFGLTNQPISLTATATAAFLDTDLTNNSDTVTFDYAIVHPGLAVAATATPDPFVVGREGTLSVAVTNGGPDNAPDPLLTIPLHPNLLFRSLDYPLWYLCTAPAVGSSGTIVCEGVSLDADAVDHFTVVVQLDPALGDGTGGTIEQPFTVSSSGVDSDPADNTAVASIAWRPLQADLTIAKSSSVTGVLPGVSFTYTIDVVNAGPEFAPNVIVTDLLPAELLFESLVAPAGFTCSTPAQGTSGTITCTAATLDPGAGGAIVLTVRFADEATAAVTNTASIVSDRHDPDGSNSSVSAAAVAPLIDADLDITKSASSSVVVTGETVTYTIVVTNHGPIDATDVVVTDALPMGLTFIGATASRGSCNAASPVVCSVGTLAVGESATITIEARVAAPYGTQLENIATVASTTPDPDATNNASAPATIAAGAHPTVPALTPLLLLALATLLGVAGAWKLR